MAIKMFRIPYIPLHTWAQQLPSTFAIVIVAN